MPAPLPPPPGPAAPGGPAPGDEGPSDTALLRRHVEGDREAFGELFRRHRGRLWAVAVRTLADPEDASEALQDAMIKAYQGAGSFRGTAAVTTWLHRIVVNACLDRLRAAGRRPTVPLPEDDLAGMPRAADPAGDPQHSALRLSVHRALAELPFDQRAVLVYIDMLGYPVEEVAAILDVRPGTVKSRASRARKRLAARLPEFGPAPRRNPPPRRGVEPGATTATGREEGNR
ncbi:RNA polymerase sigma factor SigM [Glycomyces harbinensis]|uniref:RNA polymerase sigma-70 factor, ECF subfamily n=1 Tax=Glycomyces harbinensis TaxID=58114 RepID=A0A1G6VV41_9ACTN|nr:RNA polymerase sigma factor SigM [Glycomyces harbinensis]SDD57418.1 RNA polymerase sigma-70 factor, ECF subfamily [Glycomyces harbinensis]